jgi:hypothetical protein
MEKKRSQSIPVAKGRKSEYEQENAFYRNDRRERYALCGPILDKRWNEQHRQNIKDNTIVKGGRKARGRLWNPDHARQPIQQKISQADKSGQIPDQIYLEIMHARIGKMPYKKRKRRKCYSDKRQDGKVKVRIELRGIVER